MAKQREVSFRDLIKPVSDKVRADLIKAEKRSFSVKQKGGGMRDYEAMKMVERLIVSLQLAWNKRSGKTMLEVLLQIRHDLDLIIERLEKSKGG